MRWTKCTLAVVAILALACEKNDSNRSPSRSDEVLGYGQGGLGTGGGGGGGVGGVGGSPRPGRPGARTEAAAAPPMAVVQQSVVDAADASNGSDAADSSPNAAAASAMLIRTGTATIEVDSLEPGVARLRALAQRLGGYVGNTSMQTGKDQLRSATVEIKVPADHWQQLLSGLKPVGSLEALSEQAEDVGQEFVDVQARVANSRRLEQRLIALLANRTGKLQDALEVERELARVREEIDRYEGRIRYLQTRTAISTMTVTIHEPGPVLGAKPGASPIADAFRDAWRLFVGVIAFLIASLGVLIPLGLVALLAWWIVRRAKGEKS